MIHTSTQPIRNGRSCGHRAERGFTLVELMVTIVVAAVLMSIAIPSFKHITASTRLTTVSNNLVNALNTARMEAIKRNSDTQFCANAGNGADTLGTACNNQLGAVYAETGSVGAPVAALVLAPAASVPPSVHFSSIVALQFSAQGLAHQVGSTGPYTGTVASICSSAIDSGNQRIISMTTGSILATATSTGACP
ncbi:MAG TPA: GspH/FimT family pseudopilin [Rhodanobacteraceae bacterium]